MEKRPEFCQMIEDAGRIGDFKVILAWDQDRFGRLDSLDSGAVIRPLRKAGVSLVTVAQGLIDWETFAGRIVYAVQQEAKNQFLRDLSRNSLRGRLKAVKDGRTQNRPYAYDRVYYDAQGNFVKRVLWNERFQKPKGWYYKLAPSEDKKAIEVIRWIFTSFTDRDCSLRGITSELNRRNVPTRRGGAWCSRGVTKILTNPVYIGHEWYGGKAVGKYHQISADGEITQGGKSRVQKPAIIHEDAHEPIIDRDTFNRAQEKLNSNGKAKPRRNSYLLRGVLRCGHCGSPLCGTVNSVGVHYYRCTGINTGRCKGRNVRRDQIEPFLLATIRDRLLAPDALEDLRKEMHRQIKTRSKPAGGTKRLKAEISKLDKRIDKGVENLLLADAENVPAMQQRLTEWRKQRDELTQQLEAVRPDGNQSAPAELVQRAINEIQTIGERIGDVDVTVARAAILQLVEGVSIWWEPASKRQYRVARGVVEFCGLMMTSS